MLAASFPSWAKGFCTGERECPITKGGLDASKVWQNCVYDSMAVQMKRNEDLNAAAETALTACLAEENALIAMLEIESGVRPDEAVKARAIFRAKLKADMLDIIRQGHSSQPVR